MWLIHFSSLIIIISTSYSMPQSNYADQANNINYVGDGLPPEANLGGKRIQLDDLSSEINLNKTKAELNCAAGSIQVEMKFKEPFYGIVYADFDHNSACQITGSGALKYFLELPLKGCGTKQEPQRVFTNNIVVRFHPGLEMDGDEIITLVCRYPTPIVQEPHILPIIQEPVAVTKEHVPLSPLPLLLIICGILFLSLFLLGLAASYFCLRRRPLTVIRTLTPSESIEKLSASSVALEPIHESSGSEYPGESPSEIEEHAVVNENASFSSDNYDYAQEQQVEQVTAKSTTIPRFPIAVKKESPQFNVQVHVVPPNLPPPSITESESTIQSEPVQEERFAEIVDAPLAPSPKISQHLVDDVYFRIIKEKQIIEDFDKRKRQITEFHTQPKLLPPQNWNVTIQNYSIPPQQPPQWEDFSDISSASGLSTPKLSRVINLAPQQQIDDNKIPLSSPELVGNLEPAPTRQIISYDDNTMKTAKISEKEEWLRIFNIRKENPTVPNWNVLIRVLQPIESSAEEDTVLETAKTFNTQLTMADRMKWRQIITSESVLRTLLTEAVIREDFERISHDVRFHQVFEPPKWNIIIRILTSDKRIEQYSDFEDDDDDDDDGSSIKEPHLYPSSIHRRSLHKSELDLRSITEMTVYPSGGSHLPSMGGFLNRSFSQPSLGRSISEYSEPADKFLMPVSPHTTPRLQRSPKMKEFFLPRVKLNAKDTASSSGTESIQAFQSTSSRVFQAIPGNSTGTSGFTVSEQISSQEKRGTSSRTRAKWEIPEASNKGLKTWFTDDSGSEKESK